MTGATATLHSSEPLALSPDREQIPEDGFTRFVITEVFALLEVFFFELMPATVALFTGGCHFGSKIINLRFMSAFPDNYTFTHLPETNSTNLYAMEQLYAGLAAAGHVFFTDHQLAGKGQRGKSWQAPRGQSILVSIVFDTSKLAPSQSFRLSAAMAMGCKNFLQSLTGQPFQIKWPNDLYWHDSKAGGILIENVMSAGSWKWSVVGVGINMNQEDFLPELPMAVSLKKITGRGYIAANESKILCGFLEEMWQLLSNGGWQQILQDYNDSLYGRGQVKKLKKGSAVIPCIIRRVNDHGVLLAGENEEWRFEHGEVEWLATTVNRES